MRLSPLSGDLARVAVVVSLFGIAAPTLAAPASVSAPAPSRTPSHAPSPDGFNRRLRIHNQTGWTMVGLYASQSRVRSWDADILGSATLTPGDSWAVTVDDGSGTCVYDFRAEFANGQALERGGINVCQIADYYYTR